MHYAFAAATLTTLSICSGNDYVPPAGEFSISSSDSSFPLRSGTVLSANDVDFELQNEDHNSRQYRLEMELDPLYGSSIDSALVIYMPDGELLERNYTSDHDGVPIWLEMEAIGYTGEFNTISGRFRFSDCVHPGGSLRVDFEDVRVAITNGHSALASGHLQVPIPNNDDALDFEAEYCP